MSFRRGAAAILVLPLALFAFAAVCSFGACSLAVSTDGLSNGAADASVVPFDADVDRSDPTGVDAGSIDAARDADGDARVFPPGAQIWPVNGHGYAVYVDRSGLSWSDARMRAEQAGGHLVTFGSPEENDFVKGLVVSDSDAFLGPIGPWLGGFQLDPTAADEPGGAWHWVDGTPWSFTAWATSQPDNSGGGLESYLDFYEPGGVLGWNDDSLAGSGGAVVSYVIEFE